MSFSFRNLFKKEGEEVFGSEAHGGAPAPAVPSGDLPVELSVGPIPGEGDAVAPIAPSMPMGGASPFSEVGGPVSPSLEAGAGSGEGAPPPGPASSTESVEGEAPPFGSVFTPPANAEGRGTVVGEAEETVLNDEGAEAGGVSSVEPSPFTTVKPEQGPPFSEHPFYVNPPVQDPLKGEVPGYQPMNSDGASWAAGGEVSGAGLVPEKALGDGTSMSEIEGREVGVAGESPSMELPPPAASTSGQAASGLAPGPFVETGPPAPAPVLDGAMGESPFAPDAVVEPRREVERDGEIRDLPPPGASDFPQEPAIPAFPSGPQAEDSRVSEFASIAESLDAGLTTSGSVQNPSFGETGPSHEGPEGAGVDGSRVDVGDGGGELMELSLRQILSGISSETLGFDARQIPEGVVTRLPFNMIKPQLTTGRVTLLLEVIRDGCEEAYQPAFAKGDLSHRVALPIGEVMRQIPSPGPAAPKESVASPFAEEKLGEGMAGQGGAQKEISLEGKEEAPISIETPFSEAGAEDPEGTSSISLPEVVDAEAAEAAAEAAALLDAASGWPVAQDVDGAESDADDDVEVRVKAEMDVREEMRDKLRGVERLEGEVASERDETGDAEAASEPERAFLNPFGGMPSSVSVEEEPQPLESLEATLLTEPTGVSAMSSTDGLTSQEIEKEMETESNDLPLKTYLPTTRPAMGETVVAGRAAPAEPARPTAGVTATSAESAEGRGRDFSWGEDEANDLLELRAALMTDEVLTSQRVAELASDLPGIGACLILSGEGEVMGGNFPSSVETGGFARMAPQLYANMREMSSGLGVGNAETFTVHTDRGMVSFFIGENRCLSVLHSGRRMVPGVRERLFLIARELGKLHI